MITVFFFSSFTDQKFLPTEVLASPFLISGFHFIHQWFSLLFTRRCMWVCVDAQIRYLNASPPTSSTKTSKYLQILPLKSCMEMLLLSQNSQNQTTLFINYPAQKRKINIETDTTPASLTKDLIATFRSLTYLSSMHK